MARFLTLPALLVLLDCGALATGCIPGGSGDHAPAVTPSAVVPQLAADGATAAIPTVTGEAASLLAQAKSSNPERAAFAEKNGARIVPTSDGRSFFVVWTPDGKPIGDRPVIATLHGHASWAFDELYLWQSQAASRGYAVAALQWWFGQGETPSHYYLPLELQREFQRLFERENVRPGTVLFHGFSRGSANIYGLTALDRAQGKAYGLLTIANAGKASEDFPINRDIAAAKFGSSPLDGTNWVLFCGGRDENPERSGCPGMTDAAAWVERFGGQVRLFIQDPNAGHGGFHQTPAHVAAALDVFAGLLKTATTPAAVPPTPPPVAGTKPGSAQSPEERRASERQLLPGVTAVEQWTQIGVAGGRENFAPSVVRLPDGRYRMYANGGPGRGIVSFVSSDGLTFAAEPGVRLDGAGAGALDCIASHPWVVPMAGGYRMYYSGDANCVQGDGHGEHAFRVLSAFSRDGLAFEREGVRVDVGGSTGLTTAGHGRILVRSDGSYLMVFSADLAGKVGPADVLAAISSDGLTWKVDLSPIAERAHDPTITTVDGTVVVYTTFLGDNFLVLESTDGSSFEPKRWLEFFASNGQRIEEFGDADVAVLPDGRLALYGSGKGSPGVVILVQK